ncbi:type-F conjugative transfer system pilin assembly protein TrbC [Altererythrobacter confluentis]|uniref:Type-F conjugative transfer system pilin assembly protein TrbC n=1 Tax=Allopontixanthobacter confluentis TaxID=1849021 RepID=A0A6L7GKA3_9SPHN|nr:type-F conjugative transfer system pilin assembly protein TrbC [Allopontixanthobacter confluentis]MXP15734.1 type-F conjugative transfer system pilin assembly protein TrbC [Allopontixanthobacter confluentis]
MNKHLILLPLGLTLSLGGLALAQSVPDGIDLDKIRERAAEHTEEAQALATNVRERAEALTEDAQGVQVQAQANRAAYADSVEVTPSDAILDFDTMIANQAAAEKAVLGQSPRFIAFASLSMPPAALKALVHDMTRAGGVTVLRGFPQGNSEAFKKRLAAIWSDRNEAGSLGIDPRLFRAFQIKAAPSFVMLSTDFAPCDGFDCTSNVPPHDRIAGNISVEEVLETFASGRGPGAELARLHKRRLQGDQP